MKIAVMGAGAVGCYYGGMLARAGHAVTLIGRARHVEAVRRDGLLIETADWRDHVPLQAETEARGVQGAALVLCCVKSTDTADAAAAMAPHLAPGALLLSLQNGVDNAARLQALLPQRVEPVVVYVATEMAGPGHVRHHGRGELVLAPFPGSDGVIAAFAAAGVPVQTSDNVAGALWTKLILNCAYNALSALAQQPYGRLLRAEGVAAVMRDVVGECLAVAARSGVSVPGDPGDPGDIWQAVEGIARTMPDQLSSTAQDLALGRRSEIDHLNGHVLRLGDELGIATPANRVLHTLVKLLEQPAATRLVAAASADYPSVAPPGV